MEFFNRYRNLSVLLAAILAQLLLLAFQYRTSQDVRLIRVWAVGAVSPLARALEAGRGGVSGFFHDYFLLVGAHEDYRKTKAQLEQAEMQIQYLQAQLSTADNAKALAIFQAGSKSKTLAAHVIGNTTDTGAKVIMLDRGASDGVQNGMGVRTPEGIVGKVIRVFPSDSYVLLITDASFAASVVSQKHHVHGTLKAQGNGAMIVDYVQNEETVEQGEWFFTSGDDLVFPKGIPAGQVSVVRDGPRNKEVFLTPSGLQNGLEDVLIVIDGVHGTIPDVPATEQSVHMLTPPPPDASSAEADTPAEGRAPVTDLDRVAQRTQAIGAEQGHTFGDKNTPAPNFNLPPPANPTPAPAQQP